MAKFGTVHAFGKRKRKKSKCGRKKKEHVTSDIQDTPELLETSFSKRKKLMEDFSEGTSDFPCFSTSTDVEGKYILLRSSLLTKIVSQIKCESCNSACEWRSTAQWGFSSYIEVSCESCKNIIMKEETSPKVPFSDESGKNYNHRDINMRAVLASCDREMHCSGLMNFMTILGVQGSLSGASYQTIQKLIHGSSRKALNKSLHNARTAVKAFYAKTSENSQISSVTDISVSFDGTWQKRGYSSHYGVTFCIDAMTGLVVDYCILSKYCKQCSSVGEKLEGSEKDAWMEEHKPNCSKNYDGSSSAMEVTAAVEMWSRSTSLGLRYTTLISDGDSAVFARLTDLKPYDVDIVKEECINHVQKRMYSALDKVVKEQKATMGGTAILTKERMKKWGYYYRNAIRESAPDVEEAEKKVWAILHRSSSAPSNDNDSKNCCEPQDEDDAKETPKKRDRPLSAATVEKLRPIFERLADKRLLSRCMQLVTQNANESLHSTLWRNCSKTKFTGLRFVEIAVANAVQKWNSGASAIAFTAKHMNITLGEKFKATAKMKDIKRIENAQRSKASKEKRKSMKLQQIREEKKVSEEGPSYGAGMF